MNFGSRAQFCRATIRLIVVLSSDGIRVNAVTDTPLFESGELKAILIYSL